jgi:outer membrane protein OmpA-like peptidoglycan-associated protein
MLKRGLLAALALMALPMLALSSPAMAQSSSGYYVGAGGGLNLLRDSDINGGSIDTSADFDNGFGAVINGGYGYGNGLRAEVELGYRSNDVDTVGGSNGTGDVSALSLMLNAYYDISTGTNWTPYVGVGIGGARLDVDGTSPVGGSSIDDTDNVFAYQGILGTAYRINDNLNLFADYRYFATQDGDFTTASGTSVDGEYRSHTIMVGLRWAFGQPKPMMKEPEPMKKVEPAPPPPPPPPPPPAPKKAEPAPPPAPQVPRSYLVFFDWDRSNLTAEALRIVRAASANAKAGNITRIEATGHADRSGPSKYNMGLSMRRAQSVLAEMVRQGVPKNQIAIFAKGETDPLVPTPDGVREPQNRRVEIVFK